MNLYLDNKVFLIAGSSKGIGLGIAKSFLIENACVAITGRDQVALDNAYKELSEYSNKILSLNANMQNFEIINEQVVKTYKHFGRIDGIIANIGSGSEPLGVPTDSEIWDKSYDKNVRASMFLVQAALPYLKENGGTIIFISSISGLEDIKAPLAYSMHKAALITASKKLSRSLAEYNIRVNAIAPGNIIFPDGSWEIKQKQNYREVEDYIRSEVPINVFGTPEDVGNMCVFLSSEKSKFITGSVICVDGGQTRSF